MALTKSQHDDFIYWATQYIKRKCHGVKGIKEQPTSVGVALFWSYKGKDRSATWLSVNIEKALGSGPAATKSLIQEAIRPQIPELFPPEPDPVPAPKPVVQQPPVAKQPTTSSAPTLKLKPQPPRSTAG